VLFDKINLFEATLTSAASVYTVSAANVITLADGVGKSDKELTTTSVAIDDSTKPQEPDPAPSAL
jgi:hypothetical protein